MNQTDVFPSALLSINIEDELTSDVIDKIHHIDEHMSDDIIFNNASTSRSKVKNLLELPELESLNKYIKNNILLDICDVYGIEELEYKQSFTTHVPKENGFLQVQKTLNSLFTILINTSKRCDIVLTNPHTYLQTHSTDTISPNKYNCQYALFPFEENSLLVFPSSINFGFSKLENDLTFIHITTL